MTRSSLILIVLFTATVVGCRITKPCPPTEIITKDSVIVKTETKYKDTTIRIPGQIITLHDSIPCLGVTYTNEKISGSLKTKVIIKHGKLDVECKTDSLRKVIAVLKETIIEQKKDTAKIVEREKIVKDRYIPRWVWWLLTGNLLYIIIRFGLHKYIPAINRFFK